MMRELYAWRWFWRLSAVVIPIAGVVFALFAAGDVPKQAGIVLVYVVITCVCAAEHNENERRIRIAEPPRYARVDKWA